MRKQISPPSNGWEGELKQIIDESTRANKANVKYFIEPGPNVLRQGLSKRHHIVFGRRGSGKSSLLRKIEAELSSERVPVAYVDLEQFKGHSYPDVLISIMIKVLEGYHSWLQTVAVNPANKKSFWERFLRAPSKPAIDKRLATEVASKLSDELEDLRHRLHAPNEQTSTVALATEGRGATGMEAEVRVDAPGARATVSAGARDERKQSTSRTDEFTDRKIELLRRKIIDFQNLIESTANLADGHAYLLLDDLYQLPQPDQPQVVDYLHRLAKVSNLWLKIATVKHRSVWYEPRTPPVGMKIPDDVTEIDLDKTLENYEGTKIFLLTLLDSFTDRISIDLDGIVSAGGKERLVLASGGVARDFLAIFSRAIDIVVERVARGRVARGEKIGAEDINRAVAANDDYKRADIRHDLFGPADEGRLMAQFDKLKDFCLHQQNTNCFLIERSERPREFDKVLNELVDVKLIHRVKSRVNVWGKPGASFEAFMLDLSQYSGERAQRNIEIVEFWRKDSDDVLRKASRIFETAA